MVIAKPALSSTAQQPKKISSESLLGARKELVIVHNAREYRLRLTQNGKLMIGEDAPEALKCDLKMEMAAHPDLKAGIAHCEAVGDYISRELLEDILESEEEHIDFLETQLDLMQKVGLQNWLQSWNGAS